MKLFSIICGLAMAITAVPAVAMQPLDDFELSQLRGRDGVTVLADMKVRIGSVLGYGPFGQAFYKLSDLMASGLLGAHVDVLSESAFTTALMGSLRNYGIKEADMAGIVAAVGADTGVVAGSDVIQLAFPALSAAATGAHLSITIASAATGAGGASMGGLVLKEINPSGTKIWFRSHSR
jgi:hypothetical protein